MSLLPIELVESIIDLLDDTPSLRACALVTRAWLPSLRRRLFHTTSFDTKFNYVAFIAMLEVSSGIADCIRHLRLTALKRISSPWGPRPIPNQDYLTGMTALCSKLSNVHTLHLVDFTFQLVSPEKLASLLISFGAIMATSTHLLLDQVSFARADEIRRFIGAFPNLTDLSLTRSSDAHYMNVLKNSPYDVLSETSNVPPRLGSLRMFRCSGDIVRPVLQACTLQLRHLAYWTCIGYDADALREAVSGCESLDLGYCGSDAATKQTIGRFPRDLMGLTKFVAHLDQRSDPEWFYEALRNLPDTISVIDLSINAIDKVNLDHIHAIIQRKRLQLERFTLRIDGQVVETQMLGCK